MHILSDVAEVEELSETEFADYADSAGISLVFKHIDIKFIFNYFIECIILKPDHPKP